jgi:hypothetical protein
MKFSPDLLNRYQDRLIMEPGNGCWNWTGQKVNWGYGVVTIARRKYAVHRVFYEIFVGPIPDGMMVDHMCRNRLCQNPDHMQVVTPRENVALGGLRKTHCPQGHEYAGDNLVRTPEGDRRCRTCMNARSKAAYHRRKTLATASREGL